MGERTKTDEDDGDKDGVANAKDNCPRTINPDQSDADKDGYGDVCDPGNQLFPEVAILRPTPLATLKADANIVIEALARDPDGRVLGVTFYVDGVRIGSANTPPYQWTWVAAPPGRHTLLAVATDNNGGDGRSRPVVVTVGR
jgi:hypothetical protein